MVTNKIKVYSSGEGLEEALKESAGFADYENLSSKESMRLQLLSEEILSMVRAVAGEFDAEFWLEGSGKDKVQIHLVAETAMDYNKKQELIDVSSKKKNEATTKGTLNKIRDLFENSLYAYEESVQMQNMYGGAPYMFENLGMCDPTGLSSISYEWSLYQYQKNLEQMKGDQEHAEEVEEAWDELEKSIIANLADDVKVSIKGDHVELVAEKHF